LSCYYQPRADDLLGTYYYQSVSCVDSESGQDDADAAAAGDSQVPGGGGGGGVGPRRRWRVVTRRLLTLAAACFALAAGLLCRLLA